MPKSSTELFIFCQPNGGNQMTISKTFTVSETMINTVFTAEEKIGVLKSSSRDNNEAANGFKMGAYAEVILSISQVKLIKGNLPPRVSKAVRKALLEEAGIKEASVKRYVENSVGAVRLIRTKIGDMSSQYTADAILKDLAALEIDSENKLAKAVKGEAEKSKARLLAERVVGKFSSKKDENGKIEQGDVFKDGLDDAELDEFHNEMRELMAARQAYRNTEAAKTAADQAANENETVDATVSEFAA
tara:strand:- start:102 stop:839 length:738 start_codon:yes stop_codon:yes gene_type:complete